MKSHNKNPAFRFLCSKQWSELDKTTDERVRFCSKCGESVHMAKNNEELAELGQQKKCAAIESRYSERYDESLLTENTETVFMVGGPRATYLATPSKTGRLSRLWRKLRVLFARHVRPLT